MKKIWIFASILSMASAIGPSTALSQPVANEYIIRYYSNSSFQTQVGEYVQNCNGTFSSWGMVTADEIYEYYGCP